MHNNKISPPRPFLPENIPQFSTQPVGISKTACRITTVGQWPCSASWWVFAIRECNLQVAHNVSDNVAKHPMITELYGLHAASRRSGDTMWTVSQSLALEGGRSYVTSMGSGLSWKKAVTLVRCCEHVEEHLGCIKFGEFLDQLRNY
jgi:hypothetical protein